MAKKKNAIFLTIIFLFSIWVPLIFSDKQGGKVSTTENRVLAKFPSLTSLHGLRAGLENWIDDNVGGRNTARKINNTISYRAFHVFPEQDVLEGSNCWLYYIPDSVIPDYVNTNVPTQSEINSLEQKFAAISADLKQQKIAYTVMLWPYKFTIYPENVPDTLQKINGESALEVLDRNLSNRQDFDFETALSSLQQGKQVRQVYYNAYDCSHWNQYGAFLGYTQLMNQVKKHLPNIKILTEDDFTIKPVTRQTNVSGGLFATEQDLQYSLIGGYHGVSDKSFFNTFGFQSKDPWVSYNYYKNPDGSLPKAVVVGDSYIWMFMLPNLSESFSQLAFLNYDDMDSVNAVIGQIKPDIVIMAGLGGAVEELASYAYRAPRMDAEILSTTTPTTIERGKKYDVHITVKNTGTQSWSEKQMIRLCIFQDGKDWGYREKLPDGAEVKPGGEYTFTLHDFRAPPSNSTYLEYQMAEEGVQYFGQKQRVDVTVK